MAGCSMSGLKAVTVTVVALALFVVSSQAWAGGRNVILFQPGQSSWEWLLVPSSHDGGKRMREGKTCLFCHDGEEKVIGNLIASGEKIEPAPIAGMPGYIEMMVEASCDDKNLYLNMSWTSPVLPQPAGDEEAAALLTVMIGGNELSVAAIAGCWAACHSDLPGMQDELQGGEMTKYLPATRAKMSKTGGGSAKRAEDVLAKQMADGKYLEYWQAALGQGQLMSASDGYFLEGRINNDDSAVSATAIADGKSWIVKMVRPLTGEGETRHSLAEGAEYTVAIALHENHASGRHHFTSLPMRFYLGPGEAEFNAVRK